jgi:hypothetical protein
MNARALDDAREGLHRRRRRMIESGVLTVLMAGLAVAAWPLFRDFGVALGAGAVMQLALASGAFFARRFQIQRLALDPAAYVLPEVTAFGSRLVQPRTRAQLAASIRSLVSESLETRGRSLSASAGLYLRDRVWRYSRELDGIARDLLSPAVKVQPVSVARCRWLLTQAAESPLYNSRIPQEDLGSALRQIRSGMQPR